MKELKIGERITIECVESDSCESCFFATNDGTCWMNQDESSCVARKRQDARDVIFVEAQVHTFTDEELEALKADSEKFRI